MLWCFDCLVLCILYRYHTSVCSLRNVEVRLESGLPYLFSCLRTWFSLVLGSWGCVSCLNLCPLGLPRPICFGYVWLLTRATSFKLRLLYARLWLDCLILACTPVHLCYGYVVMFAVLAICSAACAVVFASALWSWSRM